MSSLYIESIGATTIANAVSVFVSGVTSRSRFNAIETISQEEVCSLMH